MSTEVLRDGLLAGTRVVVAGAGELGEAVAARAATLGATAAIVAADESSHHDSPAREEPVDALVWDGAAAFAGAAGVAAVRAALDGAWLAIRPLASEHWIADERGGLIVLLAPRPGDAHAEAARAGLENLARTLSIEWARFGIRPVAILPGAGTPAGEVAELVAYLASPAGGYFSGCAFTLAG